MYTFMDIVDKDKLIKIIYSLHGSDLDLDCSRLARDKIYSILFALYGFDILYESKIRALLLESCPYNILQLLADEFYIDRNQKHFDLALSLSNILWKSGARFTFRLAEALVIPHEYLPSSIKPNKCIESIEPYEMPDELFDFQRDIFDEIVSVVMSSEKKAFLVQMPTGAGKTKTAVESVIHIYNEKCYADKSYSILWLAHTEELCEQAIEAFREIWVARGSQEINLIRYWGDYNPGQYDLPQSIIVASYQKAYNLLKTNSPKYIAIKNCVKIIVADEAHKVLAHTYNTLLSNLFNDSFVYLIGLTATPGRGLDLHLENTKLAKIFEKKLITSKMLTSNPINYLQKRGILASITRKVISTNIHYDVSDCDPDSVDSLPEISTNMLKKISNDKKRNNIIIKETLEQIKFGKKILVFTCSVDHAKKLSMMIGLAGNSAAYIHCNMRRALRRRIINEFRSNNIDVLFNYGVLSTGFDAPNIDTVIITRPTSSIVLYSQMIGRGLRGSAVGGTAQCTIIDVKDNFDNFGDIDAVYQYFDNFWE